MIRGKPSKVLNASERSLVGARINRSARGRSVKCFEQSDGLDTVLYKNIPFYKSRDKVTIKLLCVHVTFFGKHGMHLR